MTVDFEFFCGLAIGFALDHVDEAVRERVTELGTGHAGPITYVVEDRYRSRRAFVAFGPLVVELRFARRLVGSGRVGSLAYLTTQGGM